jgi:drug/metabolite transporter (DMT)-like permease
MKAKTRAEGVLLGLALIWGSTFVVGKLVLVEMTPLQMISIRFTVATIILFTIFFRSILPLRRDQVMKGAILGLFLFLGFVTQTIGLTITTASKSAFITGMMVVFVPLLQVVVEKKSPKLGNIAGVLIVTLGLWFLTSPDGASFNAGDAMTLVCALLFGVYIVYLDVVSHDMSPLQITFLQVATNAVLALAAMSLFERAPLTFSHGTAIGIVYLTLIATVMTTFLQAKYQKDTTPTRAVVIFTIEPVFASITAALFLGERLGWLGMIGGGCIVMGVLVSELSDVVPILNRSFDFPEGDASRGG